MKNEKNLLNIVQAILGTFDHRKSYSPGMFEALEPIFKSLEYASAGIYIVDDFPDRMHLEFSSGSWPDHISLDYSNSFFDALCEKTKDIPNLVVAPLFSHDRELGAVAATGKRKLSEKDRKSFAILAQAVSIMAYIERVRTNGFRERQERDIFFAQSLASRLLVNSTPAIPGLRTGVEYIRSLDPGGDFFEFIPAGEGGLIGFIGGCNGKGLRTVMEVCSIMREIHLSLHGAAGPSRPLMHINNLLVKEQRRAHQASLCVFEIDVKRDRLRLAKAGRLGLLLCDRDGSISNISTPGNMFLGMVAKPKIVDEEYAFTPGQSLFCVTDGFYKSRNTLGARPQMRWLLSALSHVLKLRLRQPLVNAVFERLDGATDSSTRPLDSMLALSVERGRR